ncbi:MAG: glycerol-3-phosphate 1-O-acyltransferase PlsY [Clostridia bacterium]|nr:glycerol-3-phosphate 1-O-acyltransferase PlsY [Clostridia bacterium]
MFLFLQNSWLAMLLAAVIAYLLGSVSFAIIVTRCFTGKDIRTYGSGNAGATNVLRSQGKLPALLTFVGDLLKSMLSVWIGGWLLLNLQLSPATAAEAGFLMYDPENLQLIGNYLAGVFCIIGHLYPLFFGFRGGKGVMTTLGMMLLLDWKSALILLGLFVLIVLITRMVSLGSCVAAILLPVMTYVMRTFAYHQKWPTVAFCTAVACVIALILLVKHRENIKRIFKGTESKLWGNK